MPALDSLETPPPALTALSEEERLFQTTVRRFARERAVEVHDVDALGAGVHPAARGVNRIGVVDRLLVREALLKAHGLAVFDIYCGNDQHF